MPSDIGTAVLALLATGASSFAALYGYVVREEGSPADMEMILKELGDLERVGYVTGGRLSPQGHWETADQAWRATALDQYREWLGRLGPVELSVDALGVDEIGLWYRLTEKGRQFLPTIETPESDLWSLDFDADRGCLVIHARDERCARDVLTNWIKENASAIDDGQVRVSGVERFELRSGAIITPATRLVAHLRRA